jgi:hypothetical protein
LQQEHQSTIYQSSHGYLLAEDVEGEARVMLVLIKHRAGLKLCAVKAPGLGDNRSTNEGDMAVMTGEEGYEQPGIYKGTTFSMRVWDPGIQNHGLNEASHDSLLAEL